MTVYDVTPIAIYTLTGTAEYPFTFRIFDETDLAVIHIDALDVITTLVLNTDYSVTIYEDGQGIITLFDITLVGQLSISRDLPVTQEVNWVNNDPLDMIVQENSFDKLTMLIQEIEAAAISYPPGFPPTVEFPLPQAEAVIGWSADGTTLENYPSYGSFQTLYNDTTSAASAAALSASNASNSEVASALSESNASDFAVASGNFSTASENSATTAGTHAINASNSAITAGTHETNASDFAITAGTHETNAGIHETNASSFATLAQNSSIAAGTSATNAANSEAAAATSAATINLPELGTDIILPEDLGKGIVVVDNAGSPVWGKSDITINERSDNLIINPLFDHWQRGTSFSGSNTYTADRKRCSFVATSFTVTQVAGTTINGYTRSNFGARIDFVPNALTNGYIVYTERMEDVNSLQDTVATVNIKANIPIGNSAAVVFVQNFGSGGSASLDSIQTSSHLVGTGAETVYTVTANIPSTSGKTVGDSNFIECAIWLDAGSTYDARTSSLGHQPAGSIYIYAMQVRPGVRDNIIEIPNKTQDLLQCYRYYTFISKGYTGVTTAATAIAIHGFHITPVRVTPVVIIPSDITISVHGVGAYSTTTATYSHAERTSQGMTYMIITGFIGLPFREVCSIRYGAIGMDAEL